MFAPETPVHMPESQAAPGRRAILPFLADSGDLLAPADPLRVFMAKSLSRHLTDCQTRLHRSIHRPHIKHINMQ